MHCLHPHLLLPSLSLIVHCCARWPVTTPNCRSAEYHAHMCVKTNKTVTSSQKHCSIVLLFSTVSVPTWEIMMLGQWPLTLDTNAQRHPLAAVGNAPGSSIIWLSEKTSSAIETAIVQKADEREGGSINQTSPRLSPRWPLVLCIPCETKSKSNYFNNNQVC